MSTNKEVLFDKRVVERNIARGLITREEYEEDRQNQIDVAEQSIPVEAQFEHREASKA